MGLSVNRRILDMIERGDTIEQILINPGHESTITVRTTGGHTIRHRMPSELVRILNHAIEEGVVYHNG